MLLPFVFVELGAGSANELDVSSLISASLPRKLHHGQKSWPIVLLKDDKWLSDMPPLYCFAAPSD